MSLADRVRLAVGAMRGHVVAYTPGFGSRSSTRSGHLFDGSKFRGALSYPSSYDIDHEMLRARSRKAYWETPQASAIIGRLCDNVIGTGLSLQCDPIWPLIGDQGMDDAAKHALAREIELRFHLFMQSHELDASGRQNGYEIQGYEFVNRLRDGETICILRYADDAKRMSPMSLQFILPEQVVSPTDASMVAAVKSRGNRIIDGFELDASGREIAVYIQDEDSRNITRVPFYGTDGRRFVLHPMVADTLGAVRGTPLLANVLHELQKITDGTVAELEAMVLNAVLAVWIKPGPDAPSSKALAGIKKSTSNDQATATTDGTGPSTASFDKPGLIVQTLKAGEEVQSFDSKRPNTNFATFVREITKIISASKGLPIEVLEETFNQNYSASRASLLLFWNAVERWRMHEDSQFLGHIYHAWFAECVRQGQIKAPNFNSSPVIRNAWLASSWIGMRLPSIDPQKEATADAERIAQGAKTRERNALDYNGSDFMDNTRRLKIENEALADANASIAPAPAVVQQPQNDDQIKNADDKEDGDQ